MDVVKNDYVMCVCIIHKKKWIPTAITNPGRFLLTHLCSAFADCCLLLAADIARFINPMLPAYAMLPKSHIGAMEVAALDNVRFPSYI